MSSNTILIDLAMATALFAILHFAIWNFFDEADLPESETAPAKIDT